MARQLDRIAERIMDCESCPRLRAHCRRIAREKRRAYLEQSYWGRPVPPFGDPRARILIVGLAPGAHGANRTGRIFTGDRSGEWLYRAIHRAGLSNRPESNAPDDGLELRGAAVTCIVKCAPPDNKPTPAEIRACTGLHLKEELGAFGQARVYLALGRLAWDTLLRMEGIARIPKFAHGALHGLPDGRMVLGCYHPSQQNTFTGRLTEAMLDEVFARANALTCG